jgi:hypothetical protein
MVKLTELLLGKPKHPRVPNLRQSLDDNLYFDSLTRGGLIIGRPGTGKTVKGAYWALEYALTYPDRPIFVLDASGSFTNDFIEMTYQLKPSDRQAVDQRIVFDRMGDPQWTVPFPFFSKEYGLPMEEQTQRVVENFKNLNEELVKQTPVLGGIALSEIAPEIYRILTVIEDAHGHHWQATEAKELLTNDVLLRRACKKFGHKAPEAKRYFEKQFLSDRVSDHERELRSYTLRSVLGALEAKHIRARVGYHTPAWTPKEAIAKGQIVLVSGEALTNQDQAMGLLFTDVYSQILAVINQRVPHDPFDVPVLLIIDEVPMLLEIKGMADEIGKVSPRYRSRRLQIMIIIQMLAQLDEELHKKIWALGNVAVFGIDSHKEAYEIAQQLFSYDPKSSKRPVSVDNSIAEADRGQFLSLANWIQHLDKRELILKRYIDEGTQERYVRYIERTTEKPNEPLLQPLLEIKEAILKRRAIPTGDALAYINGRVKGHTGESRPSA